MNKKVIVALCLGLSVMFTACGNGSQDEAPAQNEISVSEDTSISDSDITVSENEITEDKIDLADGEYLADFTTDSTMFHVNDSKDGKGILTVKDGKATIHIVLTSTNIVNLYRGLAADAENDSDNLLCPTLEEVTYSDGTSEEVNAFDVEVPYLDQEFDVALLGKKGTWYDHKVYVSNPEALNDESVSDDDESADTAIEGECVNVVLEGGSGKASVDTPAAVKEDENGNLIATICWSSEFYDYMIVDGNKLLPINEEGNSTFEVPIPDYDCELDVVADTTAMSTPHEIEYKLIFSKINN